MAVVARIPRLFAILLLSAMNSACSSPMPAAPDPLPLEAYRFSFEAAPNMDATLGDPEIDALVARLNEIWEPAGVQWSLVGITDRLIPSHEFPGPNPDRTELRRQLEQLAAPGPDPGTWRIVMIGEFPVPAGGLYLPKVRTAFFSERARGGPTSPVVMAHEMGHSLGLGHEEDTANLMHPAAGARDLPQATATALKDEQIRAARAQAATGPNEVPMESFDTPQRQNTPTRAAPRQQRSRIAERLRSFDSDHDGVILLEDVPPPGHRAFHRVDRNGDGRLDDAELAEFED